MKKKIVISGPILSRSGYGEMARFAMRSLNTREDLYDLYIIPTNWGGTGNIFEMDAERTAINALIAKTQAYFVATQEKPNFDISIQVTIPNEWKKMAAYNIGYTAGIETNFISPAWLEPSLAMDKIIVISEHAKSSFVKTEFLDKSGNAGRGIKYSVTTPVEVCHFPVKKHDKADLNLDLKHEFNFLTVCQWSPRKNLEQTIVNFVEEFRHDKVGLVLKINTSNDSLLDREETDKKIRSLMANAPKDRQCSIHLLHGHMSEKELNSLFANEKIKAVVSSTHGEGFGFPLFEAAYNEKPVVATDWSGHLDFLVMKDEDGAEKKMFANVAYEMRPLEKGHIWPGVLEEGTSWAYPTGSSLKSRMREVYKDYPRFKSWARKLNVWVRQEFAEEKVYAKFVGLVTGQLDVESWLKEMNVEENTFEHE